MIEPLEVDNVTLNTRSSLLQSNKSSAMMRAEPRAKYENFVKRLNGLHPGRYMIVLTVQGECDYTITELGKIEK